MAKEIVKVILAKKRKVVLDPFCGGLSISHAFLEADPDLIVHCSDYNKDLIDLYRAIIDGTFRPQDRGSISKQEYYDLKLAPPSPLRTFVGYTNSFSGKGYSGVYANHKDGRNLYQDGVNSLLRKLKHRDRMIFSHRPYWDVVAPVEAVIYCDPPYLGTFHQTGWDKFDHDKFFSWAAVQENDCYISELKAPFKCVWEKEIPVSLGTKLNSAGKKPVRTERLFINH